MGTGTAEFEKYVGAFRQNHPLEANFTSDIMKRGFSYARIKRMAKSGILHARAKDLAECTFGEYFKSRLEMTRDRTSSRILSAIGQAVDYAFLPLYAAELCAVKCGLRSKDGERYL